MLLSAVSLVDRAVLHKRLLLFNFPTNMYPRIYACPYASIPLTAPSIIFLIVELLCAGTKHPVGLAEDGTRSFPNKADARFLATLTRLLKTLKKSKPQKEPQPPALIVLTYQIPVLVGNCLAHLLLKNNKVVTAFIMDGSANTSNTSGEELSALGRIEWAWKKITLSHKPDLKLSRWVVTHWHNDHYKGVAEWRNSKRDEVLSLDAELLSSVDSINNPLKAPVDKVCFEVSRGLWQLLA